MAATLRGRRAFTDYPRRGHALMRQLHVHQGKPRKDSLTSIGSKGHCTPILIVVGELPISPKEVLPFPSFFSTFKLHVQMPVKGVMDLPAKLGLLSSNKLASQAHYQKHSTHLERHWNIRSEHFAPQECQAHSRGGPIFV